MKKFRWTIVLNLAIAGTSCSSVSVENPGLVNSVELPTPSPSSVEASNLTAADLSTLQKYAEGYQPKSGREVIPSPPVPDEKITQIIAKAAETRSRDHEKFVVLIFLRLSRFQIENFKQRYELGRSNPLTKEFYRLIGRDDYERAETMLAYLADDYVDRNPDLLEYKLIEAEMRRIDKAGDRIKNELIKITEKRNRRGYAAP